MTEASAQNDHAELERSIERQIVQRTWGRIRHLHVEVYGDHLTVHGCAPTYHVMQLAILGVRDVLESVPVELDIEVGVRDFPAPQGYD